MKKKIILLLCVLICVLIFFPSINEAGQISIQINGQEVKTDVQPFIENGRTLVPIRVISENLGIEVLWKAETREVVLKKYDKDIILKINDRNFLTGKDKKMSDVAPKIINGRTFVPVRLVAEIFGMEVAWDGVVKCVIINDNNFELAKVIRVVDGDTLVVDRGNGPETVRLILVDSPETKHPNKGVEFFGEEASLFTKNFLEGKSIYLEKDISDYDRYDRLLRYVWLSKPSTSEPTKDDLGKLCFNYILLKEGYAKLATFPPNIKYLEEFRQAEREAYENSLGLWGK